MLRAVWALFLAFAIPLSAQTAPSARRTTLLIGGGVAGATSGSGGAAIPAAFGALGAELRAGSRVRIRSEGAVFHFFSGSPVTPSCPPAPEPCDELTGVVWMGSASAIVRPWTERGVYVVAGPGIHVAGRRSTRGPKTRGGAAVGLGVPLGDWSAGAAIEVRYVWTARSLGRMRGLMPIAATFRF